MKHLVTLAVMLVGLTGCQLIINHNEFSPQSDASADSPPDSPPDTLPPGSDQVRSPSSAGAVIVSARIQRSGGVVADGNWVTAGTPIPNGDAVEYPLSYPGVFADIPSCICTSLDDNFHGCRMQDMSKDSGRVDVWSNIDPNRDVNILCVGPPVVPAPGLVVGPTSTTRLLASIRIEVSEDSPALLRFEDGDWIGSVEESKAAMGLWELVPNAVFDAPPRCACTWTGSRFDTCKLEHPPNNADGVPVSTPHVVAGPPTITAIGADVLCLAPAKTDRGTRSVISSRPTGVTLATATVRANNTVLRQDGAWLDEASLAGDPTHSLAWKSGVFREGSVPKCLCSAATGSSASCRVGSAPNISGLNLEVDDLSGGINSNYTIFCIGESFDP